MSNNLIVLYDLTMLICSNLDFMHERYEKHAINLNLKIKLRFLYKYTKSDGSKEKQQSFKLFKFNAGCL